MRTYNPAGRMTVGELIAELQRFDPGMLVLVNGYEGGFQCPEVFVPEEIVLDWSGSHEGPYHEPRGPSFGAKATDPKLPREPAVIVSRGVDER